MEKNWPTYSILNISGSYQLGTQLKLFFSGKNIADEKYIGSRLHSNPGQKDANISSGIIIQILWILLLFPVFRKIWSAGTKKYTAMGT